MMRSLLCLTALLAGSASVSADQFDLVEASGIASGRIEVERGRLVVYQASGQRTYFSRQPRYDSAGGEYVGYFSDQWNRVLRFPRSGSGYLQTADLDDFSPRFRNTQFAVRQRVTTVGPAITTGPSIVRGYRGDPYHGDPYRGGYLPALPQSVLIDSQTIPNPPLPPARVVLYNDGPRELQVGVFDLQSKSGIRSTRIAPAAGVEFDLERDAGAKRVAHYRVISPTGDFFTKEIVTEVPAADRYEVVVHEWAVQSVAIDRTGKSPNLIEDINFQGRGIGRFRLPPGPQLRSGSINIYAAAKNQGNEGTIAPIFPSQERSGETTSPLERAILESQRATQGRRP
jgi:hypothetical protein